MLRCFVPGCDNETNPVLDAAWVRDAIPPSSSYEGSKEFVPSQCLRYQPLQDNLTGTCPSKFTTNTLQCDRWVFNNEHTIVQEVREKQIYFIYDIGIIIYPLDKCFEYCALES